ncbi:Glutamyl aminopeptidase [Camponotus floridanus]|uniref:Glutamyl aminopeptidase n=1 Tax=Camponotus floridanus TaxID=104421 RepID=E2A5C8_CAMFO|nr:Glutamyl aminopeptidase [Camponotus floridanus]
MPIEHKATNITNVKYVLSTKFETTPLISTYLVLFVIYDKFPLDLQFEQQYIQETVFADNVTQLITMNLKRWKYFKDISNMYHHIILYSQNNITKKLILYRDATIFYNDELDSDIHKLDVIRRIGYELVHQWFDNLISPAHWPDYWLNEGIATLLGTDVINKDFEDLRIWDLFVVQFQQESLRLDNSPRGIMKPLILQVNKTSEIDSLFSFSFHIKGYYRVKYELKNWQNIAKYLNSRNYSKIHVLNRAQIIDDAYYFLSSGKLDMYTFLNLVKYLSQETDFVAWYPMIKALENMSSIFPISDTEDNIDLFKIMEFADNLMERYILDTNNLEDILLRSELDKLREYVRAMISERILFIVHKIAKRLHEIRLIQCRARKMLSNLNNSLIDL